MPLSVQANMADISTTVKAIKQSDAHWTAYLYPVTGLFKDGHVGHKPTE